MPYSTFWGGAGFVGSIGEALGCVGLTVVGGEAALLDSPSLLFASWSCEVACPALESLRQRLGGPDT